MDGVSNAGEIANIFMQQFNVVSPLQPCLLSYDVDNVVIGPMMITSEEVSREVEQLVI